MYIFGRFWTVFSFIWIEIQMTGNNIVELNRKVLSCKIFVRSYDSAKMQWYRFISLIYSINIF